MKYLYSYLGTLYYVLGAAGVIYLLGTMATSIKEIPLFLLYLSFVVSVVGPVKLWIEDRCENNT